MDKILVLDFGGQYQQLITRRVREQQIYAEVHYYDRITLADILEAGYKGIILTGGPYQVFDEDAPHFDPALLDAGIPVLGICYGDQLLAYLGKGEVSSAGSGSEYGRTELRVLDGKESVLFQDIPKESICWMSHTDQISRVPEGFEILASTRNCPCAAMSDEKRKIYGVQFHPEVIHTEYGKQLMQNFLFAVCGCKREWVMEEYAAQAIRSYRESLAGKKVLLALSGGVDSSVAAVLLHKAIGENLTCIFVDHGLLRKDEGDIVEKTFREQMGVNLIRVDARALFLEKLKGVVEPEKKRKVIGEEFIRVFEREAKKLGEISVLAQGTIYPDVIESGSGKSAVIKSHHNVGGLPERMDFKEIVEPLKNLFKDEVRQLGLQLGIPGELIWRQPFPGPGLAVRIIGEITKEKVAILQEADAIFREEIAASEMEARPDQYFAVLTDSRSVGVMGDHRTYGYTLALRAVTTDDFMTAEWTKIPYEILEKVSSRITNEVREIVRVVYDITTKPPATVEWE